MSRNPKEAQKKPKKTQKKPIKTAHREGLQIHRMFDDVEVVWDPQLQWVDRQQERPRHRMIWGIWRGVIEDDIR